jgi:integrase
MAAASPPRSATIVSRPDTSSQRTTCSRVGPARLSKAGTCHGCSWRRSSERACPPSRFHDLRHTFASLLIQQGSHPKYVSEQLGHASSQITLDRYSHLFDTSYSDESEKLEQALFGAVPLQAMEGRR